MAVPGPQRECRRVRRGGVRRGPRAHPRQSRRHLGHGGDRLPGEGPVRLPHHSRRQRASPLPADQHRLPGRAVLGWPPGWARPGLGASPARGISPQATLRRPGDCRGDGDTPDQCPDHEGGPARPQAGSAGAGRSAILRGSPRPRPKAPPSISSREPRTREACPGPSSSNNERARARLSGPRRPPATSIGRIRTSDSASAPCSSANAGSYDLRLADGVLSKDAYWELQQLVTKRLDAFHREGLTGLTGFAFGLGAPDRNGVAGKFLTRYLLSKIGGRLHRLTIRLEVLLHLKLTLEEVAALVAHGPRERLGQAVARGGRPGIADVLSRVPALRGRGSNLVHCRCRQGPQPHRHPAVVRGLDHQRVRAREGRAAGRGDP